VRRAQPGYKLELSNFKKYEEIPNDWHLKELDTVAQIIGGGTPETTNQNYWDGNILWATPSDLTEIKGNFIDKTERLITTKGLEKSSAKLIESGNIIFSSRATIGECKINSKPLATNQGFQNLVPKKEFSKIFIFYAVQYNKIKFIRFAYGTTFLEISKNNFKKVKIAIPPEKREGETIATILSNVDNLIDSYDKAIDNSKKQKRGLMQQLLTKGIGHTKFKKVKWRFDKKFEIPEAWQFENLNKVGEVIDPWPSHRAPKEQEKGIPYLGIGDFDESGNIMGISRFVDEKVFEKQKKIFQIEKGDLAIGRVASIGKIVKLQTSIDYTISPTLSVIKPKINSEYLRHVLRSNYFQVQLQDKITGSTRSSVGIQLVRKLKILVPSEKEQHKIASILSNCDSKISELESKKTNLEKLKKGLMQNLLTGQIRVKA